MQTHRPTYSPISAFTLVEVIVALGVMTVVGTVALSYMQSQAWLFAKNSSLNRSHTSIRSELDRLSDELQQTYNLPSLIDTSGVATAVTPAAGLQYDRLLGSPYVVTHPGGVGLPATATSVIVTRSLNSLASPPIPVVGDVLLISTTTVPIRGQISTAVVNPQSFLQSLLKQQSITLTFAAAIGKAVNWNPSQPETATLVRRKAFIVMPSGARNELRFYQSFEPLPPLTVLALLDDPTQYTVITDEVSTLPADPAQLTSDAAKPFSIDTTTGDKLVIARLRIYAQDYANSLDKKQAKSFNTFVVMKTALPSRLRPKS